MAWLGIAVVTGERHHLDTSCCSHAISLRKVVDGYGSAYELAGRCTFIVPCKENPLATENQSGIISYYTERLIYRALLAPFSLEL